MESDPIRACRDTVAPLYRYVVRRAGGSRELADDITQETYLRFISQCQDGGCPEPPAIGELQSASPPAQT